MDQIHIVVCTDSNYIMPCGVMLYSLCKNNQNSRIVFHVIIDESVTDINKKALVEIAESFNIKIAFHLIDGHLFDSFPNLGEGVYVSKATYYRLYLSEILSQDIDKVLYLDCDMIVDGDIKPLWETNIDNVAVGVSADGWESRIQIYNRLVYPYEKGYFNAGMLLINLNYWREHKVLERCLNFIKNHFDRIVSHDQDVLNYVLQDEKKNVGISYNFLENYLYKKNLVLYDYQKYKEEIYKVKDNPIIIHFVASKPWMTNCTNPYKDIFRAYQNETQWKGLPLRSPKATLRSRVKAFIRRIGVMEKDVSPLDENIVSNLKIQKY